MASSWAGGQQPDEIERISRMVTTDCEPEDEHPHQLGSACNYWQKPVTEFVEMDKDMVEVLKNSPCVGDMDIDRKDWARARNVVDGCMDLLLKEVKEKAQYYERLKIESYIRQGSSRDGLKVVAPDEFDTVLEFQIEGITVRRVPLLKDHKIIPGFFYLKVEEPLDVLKALCPKLYEAGIFCQEQGTTILSSRELHQSIFQSLIDKACNKIEEDIKLKREKGRHVDFSITRSINPPAISIQLHLNGDTNNLSSSRGNDIDVNNDTPVISLDIVPAIRLDIDTTTFYHGQHINATWHAVCKWKEEESPNSLQMANQSRLWHMNSAGYERHIFDVARTIKVHRFILTALRILKTYFRKVRSASLKEKKAPPVLVTVIKSYHLKHLALYLILYSCLYSFVVIDCTQRALGFLLTLLKGALVGKHLPHFFYSNSNIGKMLLGFPLSYNPNTLKFDLFKGIPEHSLEQAFACWKSAVLDLGFILNDETPLNLMDILAHEILKEINTGEYF